LSPAAARRALAQVANVMLMVVAVAVLRKGVISWPRVQGANVEPTVAVSAAQSQAVII